MKLAIRKAWRRAGDCCQWCNEDIESEQYVHSLPSYVYEPLVASPSTRVFCITIPSHHERISGRLVEVNLNTRKKDRLSYTALSYTWGSNLCPHVIECDRRKISITCSLNSALRRLREVWEDNGRKELVVFADCISINQATDDKALSERGEQVRLMSLIFRTADIVVADLGDGTERTYKVLDKVLNLLAKLVEIDDDKWEDIGLNLKRVSEFGVPLMNDAIWDDCMKFLERRYFTRLWVIQELVVSLDLAFLIGYEMAEHHYILKGLNRAMQIIQRNAEFLPSMNLSSNYRSLKLGSQGYVRQQQRCAALYNLYNGGHNVSLGILLNECRHFQTGDSRDRVYATMGMMKAREAAAFNIDYQETKLAFQRRLSRFLVEHKEMGCLLGMLSPHEKSTNSSWMIDVDLLPDLDVTSVGWHTRGTDSECTFDADGSSRYHIRWHEDDDSILPVSGSRIDQVDLLSDIFNSVRGRKWRDKVLKMAVTRFNDLHPVDVHKRCLRVMVAHGKISHQETDIGDKLEEHVDALLASRPTDMLRASFKDVRLMYDTAYVFEKGRDHMNINYNIDMVCRGRRFCIMKAGRMCVVPESTKQGDVVVIVRGCPEPLILRRRNDGHFNIIGTAYVDGLMYGEALKSDFWREETFSIV